MSIRLILLALLINVSILSACAKKEENKTAPAGNTGITQFGINDSEIPVTLSFTAEKELPFGIDAKSDEEILGCENKSSYDFVPFTKYITVGTTVDLFNTMYSKETDSPDGKMELGGWIKEIEVFESVQETHLKASHTLKDVSQSLKPVLQKYNIQIGSRQIESCFFDDTKKSVSCSRSQTNESSTTESSKLSSDLSQQTYKLPAITRKLGKVQFSNGLKLPAIYRKTEIFNNKDQTGGKNLNLIMVEIKVLKGFEATSHGCLSNAFLYSKSTNADTGAIENLYISERTPLN